MSLQEEKPASVPSALFVTPECAPLVKTGGLGDVSAALPAALRERGLDVRVLLPGYQSVLEAIGTAPEIGTFTALQHTVRLLDARLPSGVPLIIVDCPELYARGGGPYQADDGEDWEDNAMRFGVLSMVAAILGSVESPLPWRPDVVHCNDWPTGLAPAYLRFIPEAHAASLMTVHNLAFQGAFERWRMETLELPEEVFALEGIEFYGRYSFLKGGLLYADAINAVSPTYAREIQTEEFGCGLDGVLRQRSKALHGVLNGIDTALWNPATDPWIASPYGMLTLQRKGANKRLLRKKMGLEGTDDVPLLASVSRLTHQKGIDLLAESAEALVGLPAQLVVVGTGEREMVEKVRAIETAYPQNVAIFIGFDEQLAHLVEAGADIFLMPSRYEPCGMNQMYSQRYGTPPVGNATGGLIDTIQDSETGFLMKEASSAALVETVKRALEAYRQPKRWRKIQTNGMAKDFGWSRSAAEYERIYRRIRSTS